MNKRVKKWLDNAKNVSIIYDKDVDGTCAATLMAILLKKMGKHVEHTKYCKELKTINNPAFDQTGKYIILLDVGFTKKELEKLKNKKILFIDHHKTSMGRSTENITVYKKTEPYTPTTKMVYDLMEDETYDWIGAAGTIADYGGEQHKKFIEKTLEKYNMKITQPPYFDTKLGEIAEVINSLRIGWENMNKGIKALTQSQNPKEFLKKENYLTREVYKVHEKVKQEIENALDDFEKKKEQKGNRIFYSMGRTKYNLRSTICTILTTHYPTKIIAIAQESMNKTGISLRSRNGDVTEIIKNMKKHMKLEGGGHKTAAGITISAEDLKTFQEYFLA